MMQPSITHVEVRHFHIFCGLGGGAKGFNRGQARVGALQARFRCIGGIDVDPGAIADFNRLAGVPGTVLDMFSREQYCAFHGHEPPPGWREATPEDIRRAAGGERPHILFLSAPCKGFSGLLSEKASKSAKYQALNGLTLRGMWLALEAWKDDPVELIIFENVPRIATRGRHLVDQIIGMYRGYNYAARETKHDCGEIGGLGQSRNRFLMVMRHQVKVPPFLYEPPKRALRGVGEIIGRLPVPGPETILPMHRVPALQWKTWVRLAFVEAGSDWRSLNKLAVRDGVLADYGIAPETHWRGGVLGVRRWEEPTGVIAGENSPTNGAFSVADPRPDVFSDRGAYGVGSWERPAATLTSQRSPGQGRFAVADPRVDGHAKSVQLGIRQWHEPAGVVTGKMFVGGGPNAVADPRIEGKPRFNHVYRIVPWQAPSPAVTGANGGTAGAVADPRPVERGDYTQTKYRVTRFDEPTGTVISASTTGNGAFCVADPRPDCLTEDRGHYVSGGHYGVVPWADPSHAVTGHPKNNNGPWSVADPRAYHGDAGAPDTSAGDKLGEYHQPALPSANDRLVCCIRAIDGTWHRPFTTLELAALQSLVDPEEMLELEGLSDSAWRERIGNAVPPAAAEAVASMMGRTLLMAWSGQTFMLSSEPIWVQPIAVALSVAAE